MTIEKIAVPSKTPGGLYSLMSDHFGHCDLFTILSIRRNEVVAVSTVKNVTRGVSGCHAPISLLAEKGVNSIVVSGMGIGPLAGFQAAGINVFWVDQTPKPVINELVEDLCNSKMQRMKLNQTCKKKDRCHG